MKILLVDDSVDMRMLIELFLKSMSHQVVSAKNGVEAVDIIQSQDFDVVFMDMRMPLMDGYAATKAIRSYEKLEGKKRTPVIALTAFSMKDEISKSIDAGCDSHLVKPVSKGTLEKALKDLQEGKKDEVEDHTDRIAKELYKVCIDEEIKDLVPAYLSKRKAEYELMKTLLASNNFEELRGIGHKIKGSGGGYGFQGLSIIGAKIEEASKQKNTTMLTKNLELYIDFLNRVEITYE